MSDPQFPMSANEFRRHHAEMVHQKRVRYRVPELTPLEKHIAIEKQVWIHSVSPRPFTSYLGDWGKYYVPECQADRDWATGLPIDGIMGIPYPQEGGVMRLDRVEGAFYASCVLQEGRGLNPRDSLRRQGVWIGKTVGPSGATPLPEEVTAARAELKNWASGLVREANAEFARGGPAAAAAYINETHHWAAAYLNLQDEVGWLKTFTAPQGNKRCVACGTVSAADVICCPQCRFLFDPEKWAALQASGRFAEK